jgi:hypothetical protein
VNQHTEHRDDSDADGLRELVGDAYHHLPHCGPEPELWDTHWPTSQFPQWRAGQMFFTRLCVVDRFGRTVDVLLEDDAAQFTPIVAPNLTRGAQRVHADVAPEALVQMPPRLLQPARLRFDFVSGMNGELIVDHHAATSPICGWLLPNYLDRALLCYDPTGAPLGELRVGYTDSQPCPGSTYATGAT